MSNFVIRTSDGFGRTGDLGFYDPDGCLHFSGRLKDLIKYQGNHLYPKELETIIMKKPEVAEVVVFGLPDPDVQVYLFVELSSSKYGFNQHYLKLPYCPDFNLSVAVPPMNLGNIERKNFIRKRFSGMLRIKPGAAGSEARMLPLC